MASSAFSQRKKSQSRNSATWKVAVAILTGATVAGVMFGGMALFSAVALSSTAQRYAGTETRFKVAIVDRKHLPPVKRTTARAVSTRDDTVIERVAEALFPLDGGTATHAEQKLASAAHARPPVVAPVSKPEVDVAAVKSIREIEQERAAKLALIDQLTRQRVEHAQLARATATSSPATDGAPIAELGYAPIPSTREVMEPEDDPFNAIMSKTDDAETGFLLPEDEIPLPTFRPEAPVVSLEPSNTVTKPASVEMEEPEPAPAPRKSIFSIFSSRSSLPPRGSRIAVYDIANSVVYMPNGEKLEAHSGRGPTRDSIKYVSLAGRGPTPPNVYSLRMRESRFHGVEAIRMTPIGSGRMYGRNGFLTHSYLRRVAGDSAGCIAFADYNQFLKAFKRGEVTKVIVVPSLGQLPTYMAML